MMKAVGHGNEVIVPDKLWQFLTNLAAMLPGEKSDAKIAEEKQIRQLAGAILDYGRMVSEFHAPSARRSGSEGTRLPLERNSPLYCHGANFAGKGRSGWSY